MRNNSNKKGFTLIEMLVVLGIVMMLSTLAISGYSAYRKAALIDFAGDSIVSQIYELRDNAIHGVYDEPVCFGVRYDSNTGEFISYEKEFVGKKVWRIGAWEYEGCVGEEVKQLFEMDELIYVNSAKDSDGNKVDDFFLEFLPPNGDIESNVDGDYVDIQIRYGENEDSDYIKDIKIDLK